MIPWMLRYHHTVTVGTTQRIPFECDQCHFTSDAIVTVRGAGFATSSARHDAEASRRAELQAREGLGVAVPRMAELAACPKCGFRSPQALNAAKRRGLLISLIGAAAILVGSGFAFGLGGALGWSIGGFVLLFGIIVAPFGLFTLRMSTAAADKSVRFELPHPDQGPFAAG
jgi:hypothetical protein